MAPTFSPTQRRVSAPLISPSASLPLLPVSRPRRAVYRPRRGPTSSSSTPTTSATATSAATAQRTSAHRTSTGSRRRARASRVSTSRSPSVHRLAGGADDRQLPESREHERRAQPHEPHRIHLREKTLGRSSKTRATRRRCSASGTSDTTRPISPGAAASTKWLGIPYSNDNGPLHPVTKGHPVAAALRRRGRRRGRSRPVAVHRAVHRARGVVHRTQPRPAVLYLPHVMPHVPIFASPKFRGTNAAGSTAMSCRELDWGVGEILAALRRLGLDEKTLVIFSSDNGPFLSYGEHAGSPARCARANSPPSRAAAHAVPRALARPRARRRA